jgi:hypothetical protein
MDLAPESLYLTPLGSDRNLAFNLQCTIRPPGSSLSAQPSYRSKPLDDKERKVVYKGVALDSPFRIQWYLGSSLLSVLFTLIAMTGLPFPKMLSWLIFFKF